MQQTTDTVSVTGTGTGATGVKIAIAVTEHVTKFVTRTKYDLETEIAKLQRENATLQAEVEKLTKFKYESADMIERIHNRLLRVETLQRDDAASIATLFNHQTNLAPGGYRVSVRNRNF